MKTIWIVLILIGNGTTQRVETHFYADAGECEVAAAKAIKRIDVAGARCTFIDVVAQ